MANDFLALYADIVDAGVSALIVTRFAYLTSLTGGLGALEVSQVLAMQTIEFEPVSNFSISLPI